jgi:hypothetical protein
MTYWASGFPRDLSLRLPLHEVDKLYTRSGEDLRLELEESLTGTIPPGVQGIVWEYISGIWIYFRYRLVETASMPMVLEDEPRYSLDRAYITTKGPLSDVIWDEWRDERSDRRAVDVESALVLACGDLGI